MISSMCQPSICSSPCSQISPRPLAFLSPVPPPMCISPASSNCPPFFSSVSHKLIPSPSSASGGAVSNRQLLHIRVDKEQLRLWILSSWENNVLLMSKGNGVCPGSWGGGPCWYFACQMGAMGRSQAQGGWPLKSTGCSLPRACLEPGAASVPVPWQHCLSHKNQCPAGRETAAA